MSYATLPFGLGAAAQWRRAEASDSVMLSLQLDIHLFFSTILCGGDGMVIYTRVQTIRCHATTQRYLFQFTTEYGDGDKVNA